MAKNYDSSLQEIVHYSNIYCIFCHTVLSKVTCVIGKKINIKSSDTICAIIF